MDLVTELWARLHQTTPIPTVEEAIFAAATAVVLTLIAWRVVRMMSTLCHEAGHAVVALITGRTLQGIKVHANTSGVTLTRGRPIGPGMIATVFAGYPAASVVGVSAVGLICAGRTFLLVWLAVLASAVMLLRMRNLMGAGIVSVVAIGIGLLAWFGTGRWVSWIALVAAFALVLAGPRTVLESARRHRWRTAASDASQLAALTRLPASLWYLIWLAIGAAALWQAGALVLDLP